MISTNLAVMTVFVLRPLNSFEPSVYLLDSLTIISVIPSKPRLGFGMTISFLSLTLTA